MEGCIFYVFRSSNIFILKTKKRACHGARNNFQLWAGKKQSNHSVVIVAYFRKVASQEYK